MCFFYMKWYHKKCGDCKKSRDCEDRRYCDNSIFKVGNKAFQFI